MRRGTLTTAEARGHSLPLLQFLSGLCTLLLLLLVLLPVGAPVTATAGGRLRAASASDPCSVLRDTLSQSAAPGGKSPYVFARPSQVLSCTRSIPFSRARDLPNLDSVVKYFQSFYGLLHVARRTPDARLPSAYDVVAQLQSVRRKSWRHAEDFYSAISNAVDGLKDGHTGLGLRCPPFVHRLALPLVGVVENSVPTVRTAPKAFLKAEFVEMAKAAPFKFSPGSYADARVVSIDGKPAWEMVQDWARANVRVYHTLSQNLNYAFARLAWENGTRVSSYGGFGFRSANPRMDFLNVTLIRSGQKKQQVVRIPFTSYTLATYLDFFKNQSTYWSGLCGAPPAAAVSSFSKRQPDPVRPFLRVARIRPSVTSFQAKAMDVVEPVLKQGKEVTPANNYWKVYFLNDKKTAVVTLNTFMPQLPLGTDAQVAAAIDFFVQNTYLAFRTANKLGSRILVDVSSNMGGMVLFLPMVLELLLGSAKVNTLGSSVLNPWNMRADTAIVKQLRAANLGPFSFAGYANMNATLFTPSTQSTFFYPIVKKLRFGAKGVAGDYSSLFKNGLIRLQELYSDSFLPAFGSKPWALFSDGLCFSACSEFATTLHVRFKVPVVAIGGLPATPMVFSAGGGGYVSENVASDFLAYFTPSIAALKNAPKPFTLQISLAMRFVNGYMSTSASGGVNMSAPIEFTYGAANARVNYTSQNIADPTQQYQDAADAIFK